MFRDDEKWSSYDDSSDDEDKLLVLVIEGDSFVQRKLRNALKDMCEITSVFTMEDALNMLEEDSYDLVITSLDWLVYHDEKAILESIQGLDGYADVPVIGIGYEEDPHLADQCRAAGFEAYFALPLDPWLIRRAITTLF